MYEIVYLDVAAQQLANIWNNASDRQAVVTASHELDEALAKDPFQQGESRGKDQWRMAFRGPITVVYSIEVDEKIVYVSDVRGKRTI